MLHVYTGDGKGKTTAALGLALRAVGAGKKVFLAQFMKTRDTSEIRAIKKFLPNFRARCFGGKKFIFRTPAKKDIELAHQALVCANKAVKSKKYDIIILDEINMALDFGLLGLGEALDFINNFPKNLELVLTGRNAKPEIIKLADLATEMKMIKHYYNKGIKARKGIEY